MAAVVFLPGKAGSLSSSLAATSGSRSIYEVGQVGGLVYFTMPFIEGQTLLKRMSEKPLTVEEAVRLVYRLCLAIQYAHQEGILHRDRSY